MVDAARILARVRELGANLVVTQSGLRIINRAKLPAEAISMIRDFADELAALLATETDESIEERAAIIEYDGKAPREWAEQFARILYARRPTGVSDLDWSWFITTCGRIIDEAPPATVPA